MPLVRISVRPETPASFRHAIAEGVHRALVEVVGIPPDDRFQLISAAEERIYDRSYGGISRSDDVVFVQITLVRGRPPEKKQALYRRIVENLSASPGVRPEDAVITLVENERIDWSVGNGEAQLVAGAR